MTKTKKIISYFVLILLIIIEVIVIYNLLKKPTTKINNNEILNDNLVSGPVLSFSPTSGNFKINQTFEIAIMADTKGKTLTGIDSVIKYDPEMLEIVNDPIPGKLFPVYPILKVNKDKGLISIMGTTTDPNQTPFNGSGKFATLVVRPLKIGKTDLIFDFTAKKTNDSNFAEKGTGNDVLERVINAGFNISQ